MPYRDLPQRPSLEDRLRWFRQRRRSQRRWTIVGFFTNALATLTMLVWAVWLLCFVDGGGCGGWDDLLLIPPFVLTIATLAPAWMTAAFQPGWLPRRRFALFIGYFGVAASLVLALGGATIFQHLHQSPDYSCTRD